MTTQQVANRLVELVRQGQFVQAIDELFDNNISSNEPAHAPIKSAKGKANVFEKGKQFAGMVEQRHGGSFSDPQVAGNHFSYTMVLDATFKGQGRMTLEEVCVCEVKDGKVIREDFYY